MNLDKKTRKTTNSKILFEAHMRALWISFPELYCQDFSSVQVRTKLSVRSPFHTV